MMPVSAIFWVRSGQLRTRSSTRSATDSWRGASSRTDPLENPIFVFSLTTHVRVLIWHLLLKRWLIVLESTDVLVCLRQGLVVIIGRISHAGAFRRMMDFNIHTRTCISCSRAFSGHVDVRLALRALAPRWSRGASTRRVRRVRLMARATPNTNKQGRITSMFGPRRDRRDVALLEWVRAALLLAPS